MNDQEYERAQYERETARREEAERLAEELGRFAARAGAAEVKAFVAALVEREHRTIQQKVGGLLLACFKGWAGARSDLRNEATVAAAKRIAALDIFLPFI